MLTARIWRERGRRYRNEASKCNQCGARHFPPRQVCDDCGSTDVVAVTMSDTGRVLTYAVVRTAGPDFAAEAPYVVAVLEMDDGTRTMAQVADVAPEDVRSGMKVRLVLRRLKHYAPHGVIAYAHKAVPL